MRVRNGRWLQLLGSTLLLLALLAATWPGAVRGQFQLSEIDVPPYDTWSMLTFLSYRDGNGEVYTAKGDGSEPTRLEVNIAPDDQPELNHGASEIVFTSKRTGVYEIHKINADGSNPQQLTSGSAEDWTPSWSHDGTKIAFDSFPNIPENSEVYVMNADGSGLTRLTSNADWDGHPTWSPDGSKILFVSNRSGGYELWTMNPDGSDPQQLTTGVNAAAFPDWSPDGSRIIFNDDFNGDGWLDLAIVNADGTGLTHPLGASPESRDYRAPVWAPDGDEAAFSIVEWIDKDSWVWATANIYRLDLSDNSTYPLVDSGKDWYPDWKSTDTLAPTSQVTALPAYSLKTFTVQWLGNDNGPADLRTYDVQYRDGAGGVWTDWYLDTTQTSASFTGVDGHTYFFRCRARDNAWNLEPYPGGDGDTQTIVDDSVPDTAASSIDYVNTLSFTVSWGGTDALSGIDTYDMQYRVGATGVWTDWHLDTTTTSDIFTGVDGETYYFQCRARDNVGNLEPYPGGDGDTFTMVDVTPPTSAASSPANADEITFPVRWSGTDASSGIVSYDVQVRDGIAGVWTDWLVEIPLNWANFTGELGHTYYFQCRAHDRSGNIEAYPGGDGDTSTTTPLYAFHGYVLGNRDQPIARARIQADPPVLTTTFSAIDGAFSLHYNVTATVDIDVWHSGFGSMPPKYGVDMPETAPPALKLYLPPANDRVVNGQFESGDLVDWYPTYKILGEVRPIVSGAAHTGDYASQLGRSVPNPIVTPTTAFVISATIEPAGGIITSPIVVAEVPAGAVNETAIFTLQGVPTVIGLPGHMQDIGLHFIWSAALLDGTPLDSTLLPVNLVVSYRDNAWFDARVGSEDSLELWVFDEGSGSWLSLGGVLDTVSNTITVSTDRLSTFAALGVPYAGPWYSVLEQEVPLSPTLPNGVLSMLYRVNHASAISDSLSLVLLDSTNVVTYTLSLFVPGWDHAWWDLPAWAGPTVTVRLLWSQKDKVRPAGVIVDEISLGTAMPGGYFVYLPLSVK